MPWKVLVRINSSALAETTDKIIKTQKVLGEGAPIPEITNLINRDFFSWITIAFLLAIPISWIIMDKWLQNFAYRINLSWWIFAVTIVIQLTIAFITICLQSQKAARENPINVLKSE